MKVGMLTQWFDPETGPAALPGVFAREMIRQGNEVSVLTGFPNYPQGRLYDGYSQRPRSTRTEGGTRVTRVPLYASHDSSGLGRAVNYSSFALSAAILGARTLSNTDAVWVYNSPVSVALPLMTETRLGRKPYFLHVQDLWPDSLINSKMVPRGLLGQMISRRISSVVRLMENRAAYIGVISPSVRSLILERNPDVDPSRIVYVPNPTDETIFLPEVTEDTGSHRHLWQSSFSVMYMGAVGEAQGLDTVLEAAKLFAPSDNVRIVIVGDGTAKRRLQERVTTERISSVVFHDRIPKAQVPSMMASANVQLVSLANDDFLRFTTPSKISSIMASGLPIIGQLAGDGAALIRDAGAGVAVDPGDATGLAEAVLRLSRSGQGALSSYGKSGLSYYESNLSAHVTTGRILTALRSAIGT
ncbi:glycosyltransferase family 4 protein [Pseudarthrobacter sp. NS4]|uniref:glycosyltransferase family 4 protein n=1 Tax=Pseudarthrobacter sp. NS4 TaxID=2973976 RepID=UPI0021618CFB|nr:glycosyltransferase family 4 protein [Pseudarthrobacter sp. NS4]